MVALFQAFHQRVDDVGRLPSLGHEEGDPGRDRRLTALMTADSTPRIN